jgi:pyruvate-formate lyase
VSKWTDLVRGYLDAGGQEVQYNVVDQEALRRAQEHPEEYRDLIVRVGGYSAIFVDLSKDVQDSIIARGELGV